MPKYIRQLSGYQYDSSEDGATGQEVYVRADDSANAVDEATLPVIGVTGMLNRDGITVASCLCRSFKVRYPSPCDISTAEITYSFSTSKQNAQGDPGKNIPGTETANQRRFTLGTEVVSSEETGGYWYSNSGARPKGVMGHLTVTGTASVPIEVRENLVDAYIAKALRSAGKINLAAINKIGLRSYPVGSILFTGLTGGTKKGVNAEIKYEFEINFAIRIIPGNNPSAPNEMFPMPSLVIGGQALEAGYWNMVWNPATRTWDVPVNSLSDPWGLNYQHYDLTSLFVAGG
jgi:hypothetical protein